MKWHYWGVLAFAFVYILIHVYKLTALPIFADEAIYIRWSQLIIDDWRQYLFFPLNDGKTPLLIWLQVPLLQLISDQLLAARLLSVGVGLAQSAVLYVWTKQIGGKVAGFFSAGMVAILPYWYFHHRIALIDGLLTLWLSITILHVWRMCLSVRQLEIMRVDRATVYRVLTSQSVVINSVIAAASFGAALLTKLPAVLIIPPALLIAIFLGKNFVERLLQGILAATILIVGYALFFLQVLHPAFPQLFSRGGDFLHPVSALFSGSVLSQTLPSLPTYIGYFVEYATLPFWILLLLGLFYGRHKSKVHLLFWLGVFFLLPVVVLGKVVYPRYLLPGMLFFTPAAALAIGGLIERVQRRVLTPATISITVVIVLLVANMTHFSARFFVPALFAVSNIPFVSADREQYLTEWSSGHGVLEVAHMLEQASQSQRIAVATEGYFGTLPDALLVYFHNRDVDNIQIEGIGQPIRAIPDSFLDKTIDADQRWLVVNSHRLELEHPGILLAQFCRPFSAPCLQVWRLNE